MPALKRVFIVFVWLLFILSLPPGIAHSYFSEEFLGNSINTVGWVSYNNAGIVSVGNGKLSLLRTPIASRSFPYLYTKNAIFPESGPFSIRIKYRYLSVGNFGDGITISSDLVPANGVNPGSNLTSYMRFMIWQDLRNGLSFGTILCHTDGSNCNTRTFIRPFTHTPDTNLHEIKIDFTNSGRYLIYIDDNPQPEFTSDLNQPRPKKIWLGSSEITNSNDLWSSIEVDYIHVLPINNRVPVIILPGFGGSWDLDAIFTGTPGTHWAIPSFIRNYDGVVQSFKNAGFVEGTDLFIFPYDWRKPLSELATDLKTFIDSKALSGKVDLVGHSMGGLVARAYGQKYGTDKLNKILTVGSPHLGLVDMYGLWEGAKIWDGNWWQNVLLETATEVNRLPGESKVTAIRRVSPSLIDLFPTFPFLSRDGNLVGIDTMIQKNQYLNTLNQNVSILGDKLIPFWSNDIATTRSNIHVITRNAADTSVQKWEDGKPVSGDPFGKTTGDGTITKESATGPFGAGEKLAGWHGELLSRQDNNEKILQKLGLDASLATSSATDSRVGSFVAILRSPGSLEVCNALLTLCGEQLGGMYFPEFKLFILPGYSNEELVVRVREAGELGSYKLHLGIIDEDPDWTAFEGNLKKVGQQDLYGVRKIGDGISAHSTPIDKNQCKGLRWMLYWFLGFRNQGSCVSFTEKHRFS